MYSVLLYFTLDFTLIYYIKFSCCCERDLIKSFCHIQYLKTFCYNIFPRPCTLLNRRAPVFFWPSTTTIKGMGSNLLSQLFFSFSQRGDQVVVGKHIENVSYESNMKTIRFVYLLHSYRIGVLVGTGWHIPNDIPTLSKNNKGTSYDR